MQEQAYRYSVRPFVAKSRSIPREFIAIPVEETAKAFRLVGRGTTTAHVRCMRCGRELTHPVSRLVGIGPECGKHFWDEQILGPYGFTEEHAKILKRMVEEISFDVWVAKSTLKVLGKTDELIVIPNETKKEVRKKRTKKDSDRKVKLAEKSQLHIFFDYDLELVAEVKRMEGRKWNPDKKSGRGGHWSAPLSVFNVEILKELDFMLPKKVKKWFDSQFKKFEDIPTVKIPGLKGTLYPFQKRGIGFIESRKGRALVADEMGLGKTVQALGYLQLHKELRPVIIIVPASLKLNWERETRKWTTIRRVVILEGKTSKKLNFKTTNNLVIIINYDILFDWANELIKLDPKVIILDEVHYIKNSKAKRTKAVKFLCKGTDHIIALSGTPIVNRPIEIYNAVRIINPQLFPNYMRFGKRYCNAKWNGYGWDFSGASNTQELHKILTKSVMIRRLKKNVLKELPPKQRSVIPIEITNRKEYTRAEKNFISWLREVDPARIEGAKKAEALVKIGALKQLAAAGKIENAISWIEDFLDSSGEKLVVFTFHKAVIKQVMAKFSDIAVKLDGDTPQKKRQKVVDQFQNDDKVRLFIGNLKAAGVGITLTAASSTCFVELGWSPGEHDQAEDRVHRIGQKSDSVNAYYLMAERTIEEELAELIDKKRKILTRVLDGQDVDDGSMLTELLFTYKEAA